MGSLSSSQSACLLDLVGHKNCQMFFEDTVDYACLTMLNWLWRFRLLNVTAISTVDLALLTVPPAQKILHYLVKLSM